MRRRRTGKVKGKSKPLGSRGAHQGGQQGKMRSGQLREPTPYASGSRRGHSVYQGHVHGVPKTHTIATQPFGALASVAPTAASLGSAVAQVITADRVYLESPGSYYRLGAF